MRQLLVFGEKTVRISIPDDAKVTFGPWSPPVKMKGGEWRSSGDDRRGTLRIYGTGKDNILACFSGVTGFRDLSLNYAEQVAREEGATLWKDDEKGYIREDKRKMERTWVKPEVAELPAGPEETPRRRRR